MKKKNYLVSLSGGKDSTAMLLRLLEEGKPVDEICYCDTCLEFPEMYEHIDKLEAYIGRPITRLKAEHSFEYYFYDYHPVRKNPELDKYDGMSWAGPRNRWCTAMLKTCIISAYIRNTLKDYDVVQHIGIAADETKRLRDKVYPLVEWNMSEKDCLDYCYSKGFDWGGLYSIFKRVSCWCCPLQSLSELRNLRIFYPELWNKLEYMDEHTWRTFKPGYSVRQLGIRFNLEDEWLSQNKNIHSRAFFKELKDVLQKENIKQF